MGILTVACCSPTLVVKTVRDDAQRSVSLKRKIQIKVLFSILCYSSVAKKRLSSLQQVGFAFWLVAGRRLVGVGDWGCRLIDTKASFAPGECQA